MGDGLRARIANALGEFLIYGSTPEESGTPEATGAVLAAVAAWLRDEAAELRESAAYWHHKANDAFAAPEEKYRRIELKARSLTEAVAFESLARSLDSEQTTEEV